MRDTEDQVFLSYAAADKDRVQPVYNCLVEQGINAWIDFDRIMPGQNWDFEIKRALEKSCLVLFFISSKSILHRGYVQRELHIVLDKLKEKLMDDIYIVPIILDDVVEIPEQVRHIQCIRATESDFLPKILKSVTYQLGRLGVAREKIQREKDVYWTFLTKKEKWDGLPGYESEAMFLNLSSDRHPSVTEIADFIRVELLNLIFSQREMRLCQSTDSFNYGQSEFERTNTFDAHCREPIIVNNIISIQYLMHYYHAGAAHPNMGFTTYCFFLDPVMKIRSLQSVFLGAGQEQALAAIQAFCREQLKAKFVAEQDGEPLDEFESEWVDEGTKDWSCFSSFLFKDKVLELLFAPYAVACYAAGPQSLNVPYELVVNYMRKELVSGLGIQSLLYAQRQ